MTLPIRGGDPTQLALGRGILYAKGDVRINGVEPALDGWRDLGNVTSLTLSQESETKEHRDFQSGIATVDIEVPVSQKMKVTFTAEELTAHNLAAFLLGNITSTDLGTDAVNTSILESDNTIYASLKNFFVDTNPNDFTVDLWYDMGMFLGAEFVRAYDFQSSQTFAVWKNPTDRVTTTGGTQLTEGTHFLLDRKMGRIMFPSGVSGGLAKGDKFLVIWSAASGDTSKNVFADSNLQFISILANSGKTVALKFIGENPNNNLVYELELYKVALKPEGDFQAIGDDWIGISFSGALSSIPNPPAGGSPYGRLTRRNSYSS